MKHIATPFETEVQRVMAKTGMGYLQAQRHVTEQYRILEDLRGKMKDLAYAERSALGKI